MGAGDWLQAFNWSPDPNNIGMSEADYGGFGSTGDKLRNGIMGQMLYDLSRLPARAGQVAADYGDPTNGTYNPAPIMEGALTAMTGGMPFAQAGALGSAGGKGIRAYHGSPHDFDKFDLSKIGTGEGKQSYGHGLYFAENEGVARGYREKLSGNPVINGKDAFSDAPWLNSTTNGMANQALLDATRSGLVGDEAVRAAMETLTGSVKKYPNMEAATRQAHYDANNALGPLVGKDWSRNPGRMYEVNINAKPDQFVSFEKGIHDQTPDIQQAIRSMPNYERAGAPYLENSNYPIGPAYKQGLLPGSFSPQGGAKALREAGVPGIKYLDQGSRGAGEGSHNYVVFDDKLIDILKKYGIALPTAGAVGSMAPPLGGAPVQSQ